MGALTTPYLVPDLLLALHVGLWVDRRGRRRRTMLADRRDRRASPVSSGCCRRRFTMRAVPAEAAA
jgi:hypothetical protein